MEHSEQYIYELRNRRGEVLSTGRISLDETPRVGGMLVLGGVETRIEDVMASAAEPRLTLRQL
jgi:hypothetical protein